MKKTLLILSVFTTLSFGNIDEIGAKFNEFKEKVVHKKNEVVTSTAKYTTMLESGLKYFKFEKYVKSQDAAVLKTNTTKSQYTMTVFNGRKYKGYDVVVSPRQVEFLGKTTRIVVTSKGAKITSSFAQNYGGN